MTNYVTLLLSSTDSSSYILFTPIESTVYTSPGHVEFYLGHCNDLVSQFYSSVLQRKMKYCYIFNTLNVKSILFCVNDMRSVQIAWADPDNSVRSGGGGGS